ncbi:GNAT family N-acetyltransferase [Streptomyces sp. NBC_00190]|uniref:GNAT family N-acetyltransferase n=1 Tax=Streptomyces sp. NBC_00190 TaxID=2903634 RepID=UPI002E2A8216|nr:GNAT family N-acetyltransferase [Streptomyces sp. NBC_00190]
MRGQEPVGLESPATAVGSALVLRPWCREDVGALVEAYRDPTLRRWTSEPVDSEAEGLHWVQARQQGRLAGDSFAFAVHEMHPEQASRKLAGHVVLKRVTPDGPSAEVGYWTAAHARGRGVASRALEALTTWAFDAFRAEGLARIELLHQVDNLASCGVARKSHYEYAATLPAAPPLYPLDGHLHVRLDPRAPGPAPF